MFGFLKDKLKKALSSFEKKVEELPEEPAKEAKPKIQKAEHIEKETAKIEPAKEDIKEEELAAAEEKPKEEKGFFGKLKEKFRKEAALSKERPEKPKVFGAQETEEKSHEIKAEEKIAESHDAAKIDAKEEKSIFERIKEAATTKKISDKDFDDFFYDL